MTITVLDNTFFKRKPGYVDGVDGSGCIPGAKHCQQWQPTDPDKWHYPGSPASLTHVEEWKNVPHSFDSKAQQMSGFKEVETLGARITTKSPESLQVWYCPPVLRSDFMYARQGYKPAVQRQKAWSEKIASMIACGFPGKGRAVAVDLYGESYLDGCFEERAAYCCKPWTDKGIRAIPWLYTRDLDTGRHWSPEKTRSRFRFCAALGGGYVGLHEGYPWPSNGSFDDYNTWPLRETVESIARGD